MGRKRIHETDAARKRAYDAKRDRSSDKGRKRSGKAHTKSRNGFFVAWDGEGRDTLELLPNSDITRAIRRTRKDVDAVRFEYEETEIDASETPIYRHEMNVFAYHSHERNLDGLLAENRRLATAELLAFIGRAFLAAGPLAIHVAFSFSYDVTHILYDLPREEAIKALSESRKKLEHYGRYGPYLIKYRPRKQLYIAKLRNIHKPYKPDNKGGYKLDLEWSGTIYDTFGFFQCGFLAALKLWSVGTSDELQIIRDGKEGRANFAEWDSASITAYNQLELSLLCRLMGKVRAALMQNGLFLHRWDGAGAVASAVYNKELPNGYMRSIQLPSEVEAACCHAYAGGRIECVQHGTYNDVVYRYDINSAYPAAMAEIPDLTNGEWVRTSSIVPFGLYLVEWDFPPGMPFYPFFYRSATGGIFFPPSGRNWLWGIELRAAQENGLVEYIRIENGYRFCPYSDTQPFAFIEHYYAQRLAIKQRIKEGIATDADYGTSLVVKLGLNSLYGKTIQKVGARMENSELIMPPYYNIAIGGYITAKTRAALFNLAMQKPNDIILFATDGILSKTALDADTGTLLGQWEADTADELVILGAGIYWTKEGEQWKEKSRGIDKSTNASDAHRKTVQDGWKTKSSQVSFTTRSFIGMKYATLTKQRWEMRGSWVTRSKDLDLWNAGTKRRQTPMTKALHRTLYQTGVMPVEEHIYKIDNQWTLSTPREEPKTDEEIEL